MLIYYSAVKFRSVVSDICVETRGYVRVLSQTLKGTNNKVRCSLVSMCPQVQSYQISVSDGKHLDMVK